MGCRGIRVALGGAGLCLAWAACAGSLGVEVKNGQGEVLDGVVVQVWAIGASPPVRPAPKEFLIDQKGKEFIPRVSAVPAGTRIRFPNSDDIRHHVYSFSPAKTFEIPLYKGMPAQPVVFDQAGVVVLGCNIHDWMSAYVFVSEAPYFTVTASNGRAMLTDLPGGSYKVEVWHPHAKGAAEPVHHQITIDPNGAAKVGFVVELKPAWRPRRAASALRGGYR